MTTPHNDQLRELVAEIAEQTGLVTRPMLAEQLWFLLGDDQSAALDPQDVTEYMSSTGGTVVRFRIGGDPVNRCLAVAWHDGEAGLVSPGRQLVNDTGDPDAKPRFLIAFGRGAGFDSLDELRAAVADVVSRIGAPDQEGGW